MHIHINIHSHTHIHTHLPRVLSAALPASSHSQVMQFMIQYFSPVCPNLHVVLLKQCAATSLEAWTSTKALSFRGDCQNQCFPKLSDHSPEGLEPDHGPFVGTQLRQRSLFLLSNTWVSETSPSSLDVQFWITQFHKGTLPVNSTELLLWGNKMMESYSTMMLMSLCVPFLNTLFFFHFFNLLYFYIVLIISQSSEFFVSAICGLLLSPMNFRVLRNFMR